MFAIKVLFEDRFLYVMRENKLQTDLEIELFKTREEAEEAARIWKTYEVVEYNEP